MEPALIPALLLASDNGEFRRRPGTSERFLATRKAISFGALFGPNSRAHRATRVVCPRGLTLCFQMRSRGIIRSEQSSSQPRSAGCQTAGQVTDAQEPHRAELSRRSRRLLVLFASIRGADEIVGLLGKERAMYSRRSVIVFTGASGRLVGWRDPFAER